MKSGRQVGGAGCEVDRCIGRTETGAADPAVDVVLVDDPVVDRRTVGVFAPVEVAVTGGDEQVGSKLFN